MRIYLKLTPNTELCPFNYQGHLVQKFHEWVGENTIHDEISLYSLSWLTKGKKVRNQLRFPYGATWFISSYDENLIKKVIRGIQKNPDVAFGMVVQEIQLRATPSFSNQETFRVASPVFIKRTVGEEEKFYYHSDETAEQLLSETLNNKLRKAGMNEEIKVAFDRNYRAPQVKMITYKGIDRKASLCPVVLKGSPEAIGFAWNVGVGNGTGIGFGALI